MAVRHPLPCGAAVAVLVRVGRAVAAMAVVALALGGIPGASLRSVVRDLALPSVPSDVKDREGVIQVTVHDGPSGQPLAGARVRALSILDERAYLAAARETDSNGRARMDNLPQGEAWILAEAPGRARGSTHLVLYAEPRDIAIDLPPEHVIEVAARDERATPIAGAEIEVVSGNDALPVGARTGADGVARVGRLGAGPWRLTARAAGYEEVTERATRDGGTVTMVLRRLGTIAVHVVGEDGAPVEGAHVAVAAATLWPARTADTDARGNVRLGGLLAGLYALRATKGDLVSPTELGLGLGRGEETAAVLKLGRGRWVGVRVTEGDAEDADPVAGARVTLAEGGLSPFPLEATTDAKGRAHLGPIAPGAATLGARADGFVARGAMAVADPPAPETRVGLVRAGALAGRVVDARGYPIDGASIEVVGTDPNGAPIFDDPRRSGFQTAHFDAMLGGPAPLVPMGDLGVVPGPVPPIPRGDLGGAFRFSAPDPAALRAQANLAEPWVTRDDGTFRAAPASPGRVRAIVHHPQYVEAESDVVTLAPGGDARVDVVMHRGGALEGRVLDARDRPVEGARVLVSAVRGSIERITRTASDGTFAFAALPDEVSLTASVDDDEQPDVRMAIAIAEGSRKEVTVRLPEPRGALAVTIVDDRDAPLSAVQIGISSLSPASPFRATAFTDAFGDATIKRVAGLPLRIEASAPGHAPRVVSTDGTVDALRIELAPAESATGEVVTSRGREPVAGAQVTLYTDLGVRRARTDARGEFSLPELGPGAATLRVRAAGFAPVLKAIVVPETGGRRPFAIARLELPAEGSVEGVVVDARGEPIAGVRVAKDHVPTWLLVGITPEGVSVTDAKGRFTVGELPEGPVALEAYSPDVGRARVDGVKVVAGRATAGVHIVLERASGGPSSRGEPAAGGSVAVTLGETGEPTDVVVASVVEGSEAERAGIEPSDVLIEVDGAPVHEMAEARLRLSGPIGDDVVLRVRRGDRSLMLRVAREAVRR